MARFRLNDRVRIAGHPVSGVVVEIFEENGSAPSYRVFLNATSTPIVDEIDLAAAGDADLSLKALLRNGLAAKLADFRYALTVQKLQGQFTDTLFTYNAARIQIQAHQFKPLLKLLTSPYRRLLIADEVGLGKTIEAGIILNEVELREHMERILVICPHALIHKWRDELDAKFGLRFENWSASQVRSWLDDAQKNGQAPPARAIVSLETMRSGDIPERLGIAPVSIDML